MQQNPLRLSLQPLRRALLCSAAIAAFSFSHAVPAQELPGKGVQALPLLGTVDEEMFQTLIVVRALEKLGYQVQAPKPLENGTEHVVVANGDATFMANHWLPLHQSFYDRNGGAKAFYRAGTFSTNAAQGYLIDKATADKYQITDIMQLKDPKIAALFDSDGDGKADLTGCNPGWGCELAINKHLKGLGLEASINHRQGNYAALMADTIARYQAGKPVLYYVWTPYWVNGVLKPGKDVVWLQVPNIPGATGDDDTRLPNGKNYGFKVNTQYILANKKWAEANPAAAHLFANMRVPIEDITAQNLLMRNGENKQADIERHVASWIQAHLAQFDGWVKEAAAAAK